MVVPILLLVFSSPGYDFINHSTYRVYNIKQCCFMKIPLFTRFLFFYKASAASANDLPQFMWTLCPETSKKYDQCLEVDFPSDRTDDIALLNYVGGEKTILKGILMKEGGVHVSVTVEGSILTVSYRG